MLVNSRPYVPLVDQGILRPYQRRCVDSLIKTHEKLCRCQIPPAGGKTLIASCAVHHRLCKGLGVHLIVAPRIALVSQHIKEYRACIGDKTRYLAYAFHSGSFEDNYEVGFIPEESGTNPDEIAKQIDRVKLLGMDLIIFTTYKSFHKLNEYFFKTIIFDESQYCCEKKVFKQLPEMQSELTIFMTATEVHTHSRHGRGHNNEDVFGPRIAQVTPKELLDGEWVLPPCLHIMEASKKHESTTVLDEVMKLTEHQIKLSEDMPFSKILFSMSGTKDVKIILNNVDLIRKKFPTHTVCTVVSNAKIGSRINGVLVSREEFMSKISELGNSLIFHYDILAEGIDIAGITGVAIMRNMHQTKLIQTIGRAQRVLKDEMPVPQKYRNKKFAFISTMTINGNRESEDYLRDIIVKIRAGGWELDAEHIIFTDIENRGLPMDFDLDSVVGLDHNTPAQKYLSSIMHKVEAAIEMYELDDLLVDDLIERLQPV